MREICEEIDLLMEMKERTKRMMGDIDIPLIASISPKLNELIYSVWVFELNVVNVSIDLRREMENIGDK